MAHRVTPTKTLLDLKKKQKTLVYIDIELTWIPFKCLKMNLIIFLILFFFSLKFKTRMINVPWMKWHHSDTSFFYDKHLIHQDFILDVSKSLVIHLLGFENHDIYNLIMNLLSKIRNGKHSVLGGLSEMFSVPGFNVLDVISNYFFRFLFLHEMQVILTFPTKKKKNCIKRYETM